MAHSISTDLSANGDVIIIIDNKKYEIKDPNDSYTFGIDLVLTSLKSFMIKTQTKELKEEDCYPFKFSDDFEDFITNFASSVEDSILCNSDQLCYLFEEIVKDKEYNIEDSSTEEDN